MPKPSHSRSSSNEPALGSSGGSGSNWESASWKSRNGFMELEEELEEEAVVGNEAVYCEVCSFWLNGPTEWEDHQIGRVHRRSIRKSKRHQSITIARAAVWIPQGGGLEAPQPQHMQGGILAGEGAP